MNQHPCSFYPFLRAVQGNWRNALFIQCRCATCPCEVSQSCQGYLLAADAEGKPLLASVSEISRLTGETVDATECRGILERQAFEAAYCQYVEWHTESSRECALMQLCNVFCCQNDLSNSL
ncbi:hypothetical protein DS742_17535 [Lacrimispora amygdalina]|uniref:Uncharacterized protein n=1 Tax=Lacrimispora amygdalina TaxID=253257 RepID=A0A3E2N9D5_9FIRM|nr:hypothetical protein [Clostridium indicum]RFZ77617.1 hypothetical protein DS742_17535 [Clostridium indicum]